jgi:hypothetical protein
MNKDSFPRLVNIKAKLEFPAALKEYSQTINNLHKWNKYLDEEKKRLKVQVLAQSDRTCEFLHEQRFDLFTENIFAIAEGFGVYHRQLDGAECAPPYDQAYGAATIYCHYSRLLARHKIDRETSMAKVKAKSLIAAASQLSELGGFSVTPEQATTTPQRFLSQVNAPAVHAPVPVPGKCTCCARTW